MKSWKISGVLLGLIAIPALGQDAGKTAIVQNLNFNYASPKSKLEITFDQDVAFEKSLSEADKQIIIDVPNAKIGKKWTRRIDASQFKSNVALISPYQSENRVRITLQLKENGGVEISQDGKTIVAMIDNKQPAESAADAANLNEAAKQAAVPDAAKEGASSPSVSSGGSSPDATATGGGAVGDSLDAFFRAQETKTYTGKHITLQAQDRELSEVFQLISETSDFNILLSDNVKGKVVLNMNDVPWDQALDIILHSYRLGAERQGNVLRITTLAAMTAEREAETQAKRVSEQAEPLVVKIFPISYAKVDDLKMIIRDFMTKDTSGAGGFGFNGFNQPPALVVPPPTPGAPNVAGQPVPVGNVPAFSVPLRGSIQVDARTNSLIIRDTPSAIEKIKRIVKELDTATPQILIEGKFVEVSENSSDSVSGRLFLTNREFDPTQQAFTFPAGNNNFGAAFNTTGPETFSPVTSFPGASSTAGGAGFGFMPKAGLLPGLSEIGAFISLLQSESTARVIASPRVVAQNKESASISAGQDIFVGGATGGLVVGANSNSIPVKLNLQVTPQVTNDGSVLVKILFDQSTLGNGPVGSITTNTKSIQTSVVVDSGGTIVIGGVYTSQSGVQEQGLPILRNLPIIGPFFGSKAKQEAKDELFIFLTPRVLNEKESGIKS